MSRARKGLKTPIKKRRRVKVNPNRRWTGPRGDGIHGEICFKPTPDDIEALEAIFGPSEGEIVEVSMSSNLLY